MYVLVAGGGPQLIKQRSCADEKSDTVFCKLLVIVHSKWALSIVLLWLLDLIRNVLTHNFLYVL